MKSAALAIYEQVNRATLLEGSSPLGAVRFLFTELGSQIDSLAQPIEPVDLDAKTRAIGRALSILHVLKSTLDFDQGGDIATNLWRLYDWLEALLVRCIRSVDEAGLAQARRVVATLTDAWYEIGR